MKKKILFLALAVVWVCMVFAGCGNGGGQTKKLYNNETDPFVMSISELDGVFNPFFQTSAYDSEVTGMTQIGMLTTDDKGAPVCGPDEPTVALDYTNVTIGPKNEDPKDYTNDNYYTTYEFLIKKGLKFSDGSNLTMNDILFNYYVYLDPVYTGSTTIYSTNIQGLKEYRNQTENENEYKEAEENFKIDGAQRLELLRSYTQDDPLDDKQEEQALEDIKIVKEFFKEELYSDWNMAAGMVEEYNKDYPVITETWQVFLIMQGRYIETKTHVVTKEKSIEWGGWEGYADGLSDDAAKEKCVTMVYDDFFKTSNEKYYKDNLYEVVTWRSTAEKALEYFIADEKSLYFEKIREENQGKLKVESIKGITAHKVTTWNGKALDGTYDMLRIRINGVDPKAVYNFSIGVAPAKYYSPELYSSINPAQNNFGVIHGSIDFMFNTVRARQVPVGAGPYKASSVNSESNIDDNKNKFFSGNVVYYVRNEHFLLGSPKIRLFRYKVITNTQLFAATKQGEVYFSMPNAKESIIKAVGDESHLDYITANNLGYGYIGINAKYVKDINIRKAIMHAMDISLALEYYSSGMASEITRPMSKESWAYPNKDAKYPFDNTANHSKIKEYVEKTSYSVDPGTGVLTDGKDRLELTFTIAGDTEDHPMYNTMIKAANILNNLYGTNKGFKITVSKDPNALRKLASGLLTVWAAAWGATPDPDMYQVYHKDSTATSVLNWGYEEMLKKSDNTERNLIDQLSAKIEEARSYLTQEVRKPLYAEALDLVMELAVELPTYQRVNMFVFNKDVIDVSTMSKDVSAFTSPLSRIWELSLVTA